MVQGIVASLTAIQAVAERFNRTARNLANSNTDGYQAERVTFSEGNLPGTVVSVPGRDETPGLQRQEEGNDGPRLVEMSNVDLAREMVNMMVDRRTMEANLEALRTADRMLGSIIDLKG